MRTGFEIQDGVLVEYTGDEKKVMIPDGVVEIGDNVFEKNKTITEVVMPDSVVKIGAHAFDDCVKLKAITFSNKLEEIEYHAFDGCINLKEIELPDTLKELGQACFVNCDKLTKITYEPKVLKVNYNPFFGSYGSKTPKGVADKDGFIILAGVLYCYVGEAKVINVPEGVTHICGGLFKSDTYRWGRKYKFNEVILPSSMKYIGDDAFRNCDNLKSISMPDGIKFGTHVFDGCSKLVDENGFFVYDGIAYAYCGDSDKVVVPAGTKEIVAQLFANDYESNKGNANIHEVILPDGLEVIGDLAFDGCSLIEEISIPKSVKTIGNAVFRNCTHLKKIEIPDTVENIGDGILMGCRSLADENGFVIANNAIQAFYGAERNVVIPEGILAIATGVFDKSGITSIKLPTTLKKLGSSFIGCDLLEEIIIPEGVTTIQKSTFNGCHALEKATIPSTVERIDNAAFRACENLCEIILPEGLEIINECAFEKCEKLESIVIPSTVRKIGRDAFSRCKMLKEVTFLSPDILIHEDAFADCPELKDKDGFTIINNKLCKYEGKGGNIVVPKGVTEIADNVFRETDSIRWWDTCRKTGSLKEVSLPSTLVKIGNNVFDGCVALSEITIPDSVISIGNEAFCGCKMLQSVNLSKELKSIGSLAFYGCESLKVLCIPSNVISIGEDAFRRCKKLKEISIEEGSDMYSSIDGILMNKSGDEIVFVPAGKKLKEYVIPSNVKAIESHAFIDCASLNQIVIPASVESIGNEAFPRKGRRSKSSLKDIVVDPKAGSGTIGAEIFDIFNRDEPIVYPKLPVTFVKERKTQVSLALGFCLNPDQYEGEYAELYKKYVTSHEKTLTRKAKSLKLKGIEEYFSGAKSTKASKDKTQSNSDVVEETVNNGYKPDLSIKKPSELVKVEILEEVVQKGTLQDLTDVLNTYKTFEMTARALGLAARYRGVEFVEVLIKNGASFKYKSDSSLKGKYKMSQSTASGCYYTEYYLMIVPEKLDLSIDCWGDTAYAYSAMCGIGYMNISSDMVPLSLEKRIEVVKYLANRKNIGVSLDEMLFWALTTGELNFADALMEMGVNLQETPPSYYTSWGPTYLDIVTSAPQSVYWNSYVGRITSLKKESVLPVLERFGNLAAVAGKQLIVSQKMFDEVEWCDSSLAYVLKNADISKVNQKKTLEMAVSTKSLGALEIMAEAGWLSNTKKREGLIDFARTNKHKDVLAWLMDFKNRTVDIAKEEAKEEAKMFKQLTENPNSVSALKKKWSYVQLDDGSLQITSYKGDEEEIEIPSVIGKAKVTSIGKEAFSVWKQSIKNGESRKKIKTVLIPDGVTEIGDEAFCRCESIETIKIPVSLKRVGKFAFGYCSRLKGVDLPSGVKVELDAFCGCAALANEEGLIIIGNTLYDHDVLNKENSTLVVPEGITKIAPYALSYRWTSGISDKKEVILPEGLVEIGEGAFSGVHFSKVVIPGTVKKIGKKAFYGCRLTNLDLPEGLRSIGVSAFEDNMFVQLRIPKSLTRLPSKAFYSCKTLRDVYIPDTVEKLGDVVFGEKDGWDKAEGIYVHTPSGSVAEEYMKEFGGIYVTNDYTD